METTVFIVAGIALGFIVYKFVSNKKEKTTDKYKGSGNTPEQPKKGKG